MEREDEADDGAWISIQSAIKRLVHTSISRHHIHENIHKADYCNLSFVCLFLYFVFVCNNLYCYFKCA